MFKALQALAVVALVSTTATGAFAQSRGGLTDGFHGNTVYESTLPNFPSAAAARGAYASAQKAVNKDTVIAPDGTYLGSDPDANVRLELRRDECTWGC